VEGPAVLLPGIESRFIPLGSAKPVVNFTERRTRGSPQCIAAGKSGYVPSVPPKSVPPKSLTKA